MNDLVRTMAGRIRDVVAQDGVPAARPDVPDRIDGSVYMAAASDQFLMRYLVPLEEVLQMFVPANDIVYSAAERGLPLSEFVTTLGTQHCFREIGGIGNDAHFIQGENLTKLALAEFCRNDPEWTFRDGFAVTERDGQAVVIAPSVVEATGGWEFVSYSIPMTMESFIALDADQKSHVPGEDRNYGDIGDIANTAHEPEASPAAMRM